MSEQLDLSKKLAGVLQDFSLKMAQDFNVKMQKQTPKDKKLDEIISAQLDMRSKEHKEKL